MAARFPGDDADVDALLSTMAAAVTAACVAEEAALGALAARAGLLSSGFRRPAAGPVLPLRGWLGRSAWATVRDAGPLCRADSPQAEAPGQNPAS